MKRCHTNSDCEMGIREVSSTAYCGPPVTTHFERHPDATHSRQCLDLRPSAQFTKKSFWLSIGLHRQHILGSWEALASPPPPPSLF